MTSPAARTGLAAFLALAIFTTLLGGSSRYDMWQDVILYPLTALLLIPALWGLSRGDLKAMSIPLLLAGIFAGVTLLQLVPLPPSIWHLLPAREAIREIDSVIGIAGTWRPLSLDPLLTANSLIGLLTVFAAIIAFCAVRERHRLVTLTLIAMGAASGLVGLLQLVGPQMRFLYFYRVTVGGRAVGLLANNNHAGILSALTILAIVLLWTDRRLLQKFRALQFALPGLLIFMVICGLSSTSRMGIATTVTAACVAAIAFGFDKLRKGRWGEGLRRKVLFFILAVLVVCGAAIALAWDNLASLDQVGGEGLYQEFRYQIAPTLFRMTQEFWLSGSGLGTFTKAYNIFTPSSLLMPQYANQAHNDWLQFIIEMGLAGILLLAGLALWLIAIGRRLKRGGDDDFIWLLAGLGALAVLVMASATDYALRVPTVQLAVSWLLLLFASRVRLLSHDNSLNNALSER